MRRPPGAKRLGRTGKQLLFPRGDLAGVHIEPLRQLGERAFVAHRGQGDLRLELGGMVPTGRFDIGELLEWWRKFRRGSPLVYSSSLFRIPEPLHLPFLALQLS